MDDLHYGARNQHANFAPQDALQIAPLFVFPPAAESTVLVDSVRLAIELGVKETTARKSGRDVPDTFRKPWDRNQKLCFGLFL